VPLGANAEGALAGRANAEGALAGALLWTFVLVRYLSIEHISFCIGITSLFSALLCGFFYRQRIVQWQLRCVELALGTVLIFLGCYFGRGLAVRAEQYLYRDPIVASLTSAFQHIVLTKNHSGKVCCYINGHLQFNEADEAIYHENLVHPAMHLAEKRARVLILGGGDGLALREVLDYADVEEVTLVDLDPTITEMARQNPELVRMNRGSMTNSKVKLKIAQGVIQGDTYQHGQASQYERFSPTEHPTATLHLLHLDAAEYVKSLAGEFDVMILDFPDPNSPDLAKLYGRPFYDHIARMLRPGGVVVQQSGSCVQAREAFLCIGRTWQAAGLHAVPYHDHVPSFGEWGWWIAKAGQSADQTKAELRDIGPLMVETDYLTSELMGASLLFGKFQLFSHHHDFTSLTQPRVYDYFMQGWNPAETP
jgi:spermidine synthase